MDIAEMDSTLRSEDEPFTCFTCRKNLTFEEAEERTSFTPELYDKVFQKISRLINSSRKPKNRRASVEKLGYFCSLCRGFAYQLYQLSQSLINHKRANGQDEVKILEKTIKSLESKILFKNLGKDIDEKFNFAEKAEECLKVNDVTGYWANQIKETIFSKHVKNPRRLNELKNKYEIQFEPEDPIPVSQDQSSEAEQSQPLELESNSSGTAAHSDSEPDKEIAAEKLSESESLTTEPTMEPETLQSPMHTEEVVKSSDFGPEARQRARKQAITSRFKKADHSPTKITLQTNPLGISGTFTEEVLETFTLSSDGLEPSGHNPVEPETPVLPRADGRAPIQGDFFCDICNKKFGSRNSLNGHVWVHRKPYCALCRQFFTEQQDLDNHNNVAHSLDGKHFCYICQKMFEDPHKLIVHLRCHKEFSSYSCSAVNCIDTFRTKLECIRHMKTCPFVPKQAKIKRKRPTRKRTSQPGGSTQNPRVVNLRIPGHELDMDLIELTPTESDTELPYYLMDYSSENYGMEIEEAEPYA